MTASRGGWHKDTEIELHRASRARFPVEATGGSRAAVIVAVITHDKARVIVERFGPEAAHERTIEAVNGILDSRHPLIDKPVHPADKQASGWELRAFFIRLDAMRLGDGARERGARCGNSVVDFSIAESYKAKKRNICSPFSPVCPILIPTTLVLAKSIRSIPLDF